MVRSPVRFRRDVTPGAIWRVFSSRWPVQTGCIEYLETSWVYFYLNLRKFSSSSFLVTSGAVLGVVVGGNKPETGGADFLCHPSRLSPHTGPLRLLVVALCNAGLLRLRDCCVEVKKKKKTFAKIQTEACVIVGGSALEGVFGVPADCSL